MKKIITIFTLLVSLGSFAQGLVSKKVTELIGQNVTFKHYAVFNAAVQNTDAQIKQTVDKATFATIKMQTVSEITARKDNYIEIEIPYD
jgi:hypothetical protein